MRKIRSATHARGRGAIGLSTHRKSQLASTPAIVAVFSRRACSCDFALPQREGHLHFSAPGFIRSAFFISLKIKVAKMAASVVSFLVFTIFWGVVGIVLPFLVPKGANRGVLQAILMLTAATCWLFWLCCYMAQMNPLIGPKLTNHTLLVMAREWGKAIEQV